MDKIEKGFINNSLHEAASLYADATKNLDLWQSEKYAFEKYLYQDDTILDIGCGTGRSTFALYKKGFQSITGFDITPATLHEAEKYRTNITWIYPLSLEMQRNSLSTIHHSIKQSSLLMV